MAKTIKKSPAAKLHIAADKLQTTIDKHRAHRTVNTHRKFRQWESALSKAHDAEVVQDKLRALADLWDAHTNSGSEDITGPLSWLQDITSKAQLERLLQQYSAPREDLHPDEYDYFKKMGIVGDHVFAKAKQALADIGNPDAGKDTPADILRRAEIEVALSKIPGYFPTPPELTKILLGHLLPGEKYERVLEPSAGSGHMVEVIKDILPDAEVDCIEWSASLRRILKLKGYCVISDDIFDPALDEQFGTYDLVVMNPPFEKGADMDHVMRAYNFLRHGGTLLAVMGAGAFFRKDKKAQAFRDWLISVNGMDYKLPEGSFKNSDRSTGVSTQYIVIHKPARPIQVVVTED